ncbi:hypothetical protein T492DRAFT_1059258 [Pavlovales sp. CCMP2436]|nr:hypothetical protein T492DRAFT_1059258 [Pavlovales sp. CCMP2436]
MAGVVCVWCGWVGGRGLYTTTMIIVMKRAHACVRGVGGVGCYIIIIIIMTR